MDAYIALAKKTENKCKDHYYFVYTVVFVVTALFVFSCFWFNGKSFVWLYDGWQQHLKGLLYYAKWMRSIIKGLIFAHTLNVPTYSFSIGY